MGLGALAFLAGIVALQSFADLPDLRWTWLLLLLPLLLWVRPLRLPALLIAGFLWALWRVDLVLSQGLPEALEGKDLDVEGVIASLPESQERGLRFAFDIGALRYQGRDYPSPGLVRLSWYEQPPQLRAGDAWRLTVRLKRPHGLMNPGGFDYEAWLFQQRLRATGYVVGAPENRRLASDPLSRSIDRLRQKLSDGIDRALAGRPFAGIIVALAVGEPHGIAQSQWQVFRDTGTIHLMAISGSHITLVAGLVFFLARWLWALPGRTVLLWPAPKAGAVAGLLAATCYAALSGFSIPTQRAVVMLSVAMSALLLQRAVVPSRVLALALFLVLLLDPLGVLTAGFWLSFATVALIFYGMGRRVAVPGNPWWKWGRVHWLIALGLLPLTLFLFQRNPWIGPLANLVAVPWIELLVVPVTLLGSLLLSVSSALGGLVLQLAERMVGWLWPLLQWLAGWNFSQWAPVGWTVLPALVGVLWLLAPRGMPARWLGAVWLFPLLWLRPPAPGPGDVWLTLLDVGQGLAAVVRTQHHALVYDTGPAFSAELDAGAAVVVPFLRAVGVRSVDALIVSHKDTDHSGGAASLMGQARVERLLSSEDRIAGRAAERCYAGQAWSWDGAELQMLHPPKDSSLRGNNACCVLRVQGPGGSLMLTGDIERLAEGILLSRGEGLRSDILLAPHHGSAGSSSVEFIAAVRPSYVLFSTGYRNRFGFPRSEVVERYRAAGSRMLDTARHGAITFKLGRDTIAVDTYRQSARHYWNTP